MTTYADLEIGVHRRGADHYSVELRFSHAESDADVRFTPGGIRTGAAGHDVCFIHPKGNDDTPRSGEGVLIELVQAPPDVIAALG